MAVQSTKAMGPQAAAPAALMPLLPQHNDTNSGCDHASFDQHSNHSLNDILLNRSEFLCLVTVPTQDSNDFTDDESVFGLFDVDEKGYISVHDLQRVATELNWYGPKDDISLLLQSFPMVLTPKHCHQPRN
jgi:hypothetical protein